MGCGRLLTWCELVIHHMPSSHREHCRLQVVIAWYQHGGRNQNQTHVFEHLFRIDHKLTKGSPCKRDYTLLSKFSQQRINIKVTVHTIHGELGDLAKSNKRISVTSYNKRTRTEILKQISREIRQPPSSGKSWMGFSSIQCSLIQLGPATMSDSCPQTH